MSISANQPSQALYSPTELNLFARHSRATYKQANGTQAPPWNRQRPIQRWSDPTAASLPPDEPYIVEYWDLRQSGPIRRKMAVTNAEAAAPNLPGQYDYAKYAPAKSGAYMDILDSLGRPTGERRYLPAEDLSHLTEARAMAKMISAIVVVSEPYETVLSEPFGYHFEAGEERRFWNLTLENGVGSVNVGRLLRAMHANGIGAPGHWAYANGGLTWVSEIPTDVGEREHREIPIPQRALLPNERWSLSNPISGPMVERTDMAETVQQDNLKAMPARVAEILERVTKIQESLK